MLKDAAGYPVPIQSFGTTTTVNLSVSPALGTLTPLRWYRIWSSVDCFIKQGDATVSATTSDTPVTAKQDSIFCTLDAKHCISGIVASGSGVLYLTEVFI
jgi:hypothetical protein